MENSATKLLVVDDIVDWQKTLKGVLEDHGYDVAVAGSMDDAISLLDQRPFDLALLDMRLDEADEGNEDGLKLAETIRDRWPQVRIVIVTGYGTPESLSRSLVPDIAGKRLAEDYLPKGDTDKLVEMVRHILGK